MYNYMEAIKDDVRQAIKWDYPTDEWKGRRDELEEKLNDDLWINDSVTGNASGSYTCNSSTAREYVTEDGISYISDMCAEFGIEAEEIGRRFIQEDWEWMDVSIRCYLLGQAISEALDELEEEWDEEDEEQTEESESIKMGA